MHLGGTRLSPFHSAPTRMLASVREDSVRPTESLQAIAKKLDVKLETADMMDLYAVERAGADAQAARSACWSHGSITSCRG